LPGLRSLSHCALFLMVEATVYGTSRSMTQNHPRRRRFMAASLLVAAVCLCIAVISFGFSSTAVDSDELLSKYAVKKVAARPLGKVELAVLKIKTRASEKVKQLSSKLKDADEILSRKEETLESETRRLQLAQKRLDHIKAVQKTLKHRRDVLKDAKRKFETQQSNAQNKADSLKVRDCDSTLHAFL